jgi:hypothetical protein
VETLPISSSDTFSYIICLTIGPVFFSAAIYITLSRIIVHYGPQYSRFSPKAVSLTFMTFDFVALVLQAVGGAIADTAENEKDSDAGTHIMVAGLTFQVLCLLLFIGVAAEFAFRVTSNKVFSDKVTRDQETFQSSTEATSDNGKFNKNSERSFKLFLLGASMPPDPLTPKNP